MELCVRIPPRSPELIADILVSAVTGQGSDERARGCCAVTLALAEPVLAGQGFEPCRSGRAVRLRNCPFHPLAARAPEFVCGLNHAYVAGVLDGIGAGDRARAELAPRTGECCVQLRPNAADSVAGHAYRGRMLVAVATFAAAATLVILFPGPDTLVVLRSVLRGGRRRGAATAAGILTGLTLWIVVAALGLAAVLRASEVLYNALRIAGACYLVWLGLQSLRAVLRSTPEHERRAGGIVGTGFVAGLVTNLLNPKVGVFFVTFLPGFVPPGYPVGWFSLLLGAIFLVLSVSYFVGMLAFAARLGSWLTNPRVRRRLDAVTGMVLLGFGVRLAVES